MRLLTLQLSSFQGIRDARFDFNGANADVFGDNATGKTTLFNALTWLLFGKASTGAKNFTPKTKGPDGDLHYLDHAVEGKFTLDDGQILTLRKVYKEDYKTKRGSSQKEFNGHITDHFIDGVPAKEKDFTVAIEGLIGVEAHIKMLMMPDYFAEAMPWEKRREILLEMCGDVTDEDVISGNPELTDLLEYLAIPGAVNKRYTVDEYKKIAAGKHTEINKELKLIPARIDEAHRGKPDVAGLNIGPITANIALVTGQIEGKEREKQEVLSGDNASENIRKEVSALQTQIAEARAAYSTENAKANEAALAEVSRLKTEASDIRNDLNTKKNDLTAKKRELASLNTMREKVTTSWQKVNAEAWQGDETCPTCQRPLPEEEVERAKEEFNLNKSNRMEAIVAEGRNTCSAEMVAEVEAAIAAFDAEIPGMEARLQEYEQHIAEAEKKIKEAAPFDTTEAYTSAMAQINELNSGASKTSSKTTNQINLINTQITELRTRLEGLHSDKSKLDLAAKQQKRVDELANDEKRLSAEHEYLQRGVFLCEEFIKAKVSMLTDKINGKFATVRFRLFIEQINGGIKEDCEVMVPGEEKMVPYTYANNAARINAGLEIINALAQHWGISVPVFVDNAEGVTRLQHIEGQLIRLVVSAADPTLRMEVHA